MALTFTSQSIRGSHGPLIVGSPEPQLRRVHYFDIVGEAEIAGQSGGRQIFCEHILHGRFASFAALVKALAGLDSLVGVNGRLAHSSGIGTTLQRQNFDETTFEGYEFRQLAGQTSPGPLRDLSGTLFDDNGIADSGWFVGLMLKFRQLFV